MPNEKEIDQQIQDQYESGERVVQPIPEKVLFSWMALARPFKKRSREFYSTVGVIVLLLSVILFFAREFLLIGVIMSLAFVSYVLGSVHPEKIQYNITNKGIKILGKYYFYELLGRFWFEDKWDQRILMVEHFGGFPTAVVAVVNDKNEEEKIKNELTKYLINQKPEPTPIDNAAKWISEKIPLESE